MLLAMANCEKNIPAFFYIGHSNSVAHGYTGAFETFGSILESGILLFNNLHLMRFLENPENVEVPSFGEVCF